VNRNFFGVGPIFFLLFIIYSLAICGISRFYFPDWKFVFIDEKINFFVAVIFIVVGCVVFLLSIFASIKFMGKGILYTEDIYSVMRHPMYGAWILYIVSGLIFLSHLTLGLTIPPFMYLIFRFLIVKEEEVLKREFGE